MLCIYECCTKIYIMPCSRKKPIDVSKEHTAFIISSKSKPNKKPPRNRHQKNAEDGGSIFFRKMFSFPWSSWRHNRTGWSRSNGLDLHSEGTWLESSPGQLLILRFVVYLRPSKCWDSAYIRSGRAVAQAVSRWLPTAAARVRARVWSCGICGGQSGAGAGFLRVLRFPLPIFIPPICPQSPSSIIWAWYNRQVVAAVPSGLSLTPLTIINNTLGHYRFLPNLFQFLSCYHPTPFSLESDSVVKWRHN
jgi:hypothetical protein